MRPVREACRLLLRAEGLGRIRAVAAGIAALTSLAAALQACQRYDFEPVTPLAVMQEEYSETVTAVALKPNLLLLVDTSKSMDLPTDAGVSRIVAVVAAMSDFLATDPPVARTALMLFPEPPATPSGNLYADACRAPTGPTVDFSPRANVEQHSVDLAKAAEVSAALAAAAGRTAGGTPTQAALRFAASLPGLSDKSDGRGDYVLLLTDGLPNCNVDNPNNVCAADNTVCRCTSVPATSCLGSSETCHRGCLDQDGTVDATAALRRAGVQTIVVGFGDETGSSEARGVLNAVAEAGGVPRACPNGLDSECAAGDTCEPATRRCRGVSYYQATSAGELVAALRAIAGAIKPEPCVYPIQSGRRMDPAFIAVRLNGEPLLRGPDAWDYVWRGSGDAGAGGGVGEVVFAGAACDRLRASTPVDPVELVIRSLVPLGADAGS